MPREYVTRCSIMHGRDLRTIEASWRKIPRSIADWERTVRNEQSPVHALLRDGLMLGYVIHQTIVDAELIRELVIHPGFRRQGHGRRLVEWLREQAPGGLVSHFVHERNVRAQLFLKACGLRCTSSDPGADGERVYLFEVPQCVGVGASR